MEAETRTWSEFPNGGKGIVEQILAEEINIKGGTIRLTVRDLSRKVN